MKSGALQWDEGLEDLEVGGADRLAGAIAQVRSESSQVLLLDAGDLIGDSMIAELSRGEALPEVFESLGYDAIVIGNHEPDFGGETLKQTIERASFSVLAANVRHKSTGELIARPHFTRQLGELTIGVFGLAYPKTEWTTAPNKVKDLNFDDPIEAARRSVRELREQGADVIVALTHLGLGADIELANQVEGIDVIVGGHSHNRMEEAHAVGGTLVVQAGAHGSDLGRLDLFVENGLIVEHRRVLYPLLVRDFPAQPATVKLLEEILAPHRDILEEPVGEAAAWLIRAQTMAGQEPRKRDQQSPVDSLFADILRETTGADVAFLPGVGYGLAIPPGPITTAQLRQLIPHDGQVVTMRLSGAELRDALEQAVENAFTEDLDKKVGGMIQVSGLRFDYDPNRPRGRRVLGIQLDHAEWGAEREYRIATNSMLAGGGHRQSTFTKGREVQQHSSQYETIKRHFRQQQTVAPPEDIRIRRVEM